LFDKEVKGELLGGIDFGFTNPCAVLQVIKDSDKTYWVKDEWYKRQRTESQIADYVASCKFSKVYPDPESASAIEVLNQKGIRIVDVVKGKDSVMSGINRVREMFKANKIRIHKSCINLISELETYSYPERQGGHNEQENPIKENDHALDALRYVIMMDSLDLNGSETRTTQSQHFTKNEHRQILNSTK
jgi:phage terminase large subunit